MCVLSTRVGRVQTYQHSDAAFSSDYLRVFFSFIQSRGFNASQLLEHTGVDDSQLKNLPYINFLQCSLILNNAHRLLNDPDWGLLFGEKLHVGTHGLLGHLSISADNSLQSLQAYHEYLKVRSQLIAIRYELIGQKIIVIFEPTYELGESLRYLIDCCISGFLTLLRSKLSIENANVPVRVAYKKPESTAVHQRILGLDVEFDAGCSSIELPLELLKSKNPAANPHIFQLVKQQSEAALANVGDRCLEDRLVGLLMERPEEFVTQAVMAKKLNVAPRTLRRRLQENGSTYQQLQSKARKKIATELLRDTDFPIKDVANRLGYSEEVNFNRAFRRWVGQSPAEYRKNSGSPHKP